MVDTEAEKALCFECYTATGMKRKCLECNRFFHKTCIKSDAERKKELEPYTDRKSLQHRGGNERGKETDAVSSQLCFPCSLHVRAEQRTEPAMTKEEVNYLLNFIYKRIVVFNSNGSVDLTQIERKVRRQMYEFPEELLIDMMDVRYKIAIEHGINSLHMQCIQYMFTDALFEVGEAVNCPDCFRQSNERFDDNWFAKPCTRKDHQLVYAKMNHFPYWPAKVIKTEEDTCDVRFFGRVHSRYIINKRHLKPITEDIVKLNNGNISDALRVALDELQKHHQMVKQGKEKFSFENEQGLRDMARKLKIRRGLSVEKPSIDHLDNRPIVVTDDENEIVTPPRIKNRRETFFLDETTKIKNQLPESKPKRRNNRSSTMIEAPNPKTNILLQTLSGMARKIESNLIDNDKNAVAGSSKLIAQPLALTPSEQLEVDLTVSEDGDEQVNGATVMIEHDYWLSTAAAAAKKQKVTKRKDETVNDNQKKRKMLNEPSSSKKAKQDRLERPSTSKANENPKRESGRKIDIDKNKDTKPTSKPKKSNLMEREKTEEVKKTFEFPEKSPMKKDELNKRRGSTSNQSDEKREITKNKLLQMILINKKLKREEAQKQKEDAEVQRIKTELLDDETGDVIESELARRFRHIQTCLDVMDDIDKVKQAALKLIKMEAERPFKIINDQREQIKALKKKQWCTHCEKELNHIIDSYCSEGCQRSHIAACAIKLE